MMHQKGVHPNHFTLSSVFRACSIVKAIQEGNQIHGHSTKLGYNSSIYVQATLVDMYTKLGRVQEALQLLWAAPEHNVVLYNTMITYYAKGGDMKAARELFDKMSYRDSVSWQVMISGYGGYGDTARAKELFDQIEERDINSWNALILGYCHNGEWYEAMKLFNEMRLATVKPNQVSMAILMSACGHLGASEIARQLHGFLEKSCIEMNCYVFNSLVDMYAKCGNVSEAYKVFSEIPVKDVVSYNIIILGFASHGLGYDAIKFFSKMLDSGIQPDIVTFLGILSACSHAGLVDTGRKYFECMSRDYAIEPAADHYACMVDLYGRAGLIKDAYDLVKSMSITPHAGVWGALLNACRMHCNIDIGRIAAQELFSIEPVNPGNYVLLSNLFARAHLWDNVAEIRHTMRRRVPKTMGCSWIDVNGEVNEFLVGDATHPHSNSICDVLRHLSIQMV
ncbi:pentatricopeptide repeat-containing protein [Canna indica]|uniref:Pentatricopeptide repeat-containing protein n=1 Tax=Canna indica TaxID=4628 RepID=A0AAQ3JUK7_9LILI|nr:pentatricopeptide repeat-containing protein [Canna indica]